MSSYFSDLPVSKWPGPLSAESTEPSQLIWWQRPKKASQSLKSAWCTWISWSIQDFFMWLAYMTQLMGNSRGFLGWEPSGVAAGSYTDCPCVSQINLDTRMWAHESYTKSPSVSNTGAQICSWRGETLLKPQNWIRTWIPVKILNKNSS